MDIKKDEKDEGSLEEPENEEEEETPDSENDGAIDYEAELEAEKKRGVPDPKKAKEAFRKRSEKRHQDEDEEDADDDDKPMSRRELEEVIKRERQTAYKQAQADRIQELARELSESDAEATYIMEIHKNRTFPESLSLREQLEEAAAIANRKRLVSKNKELTRALNSKNTASNGSAGTHKDGMSGSAPKMSAQDTAAYARAGFSFDTKSRIWKKPLPNKKFLFKDPKSKRTWIG